MKLTEKKIDLKNKEKNSIRNIVLKLEEDIKNISSVKRSEKIGR